jgi:hypothetical protein
LQKAKRLERKKKMKRIVVTMTMGAVLLGTATLSFADEKIHQRKVNQQQRIGNGVKNGSLTPGETAHLEHKEKNLNQEIRADRKANGGNLTNNEKAQVNQQQNKLSKDIYKDKHN